MRWYLVALWISSFLLSLVALCIHVNPSNQATLRVVTNTLYHLLLTTQTFSNYPPSNVTVDEYQLRLLMDCETFVLANVPNTTALMAELLVFDPTTPTVPPPVVPLSTGVVTTVQSGTVVVNNVTVLPYQLQYMLVDAGHLNYVSMLANSTLYYVVNNGTLDLVLDNWSPPIYESVVPSGGFDPIYDRQRTKVQSAADMIFPSIKRFNGTAIVLSDTVNPLYVGDVVAITRAVQL